ncbi:MAG: hypothetical protein AB7Q27_29585, partial [Acidimicrobiia bacterium]
HKANAGDDAGQNESCYCIFGVGEHIGARFGVRSKVVSDSLVPSVQFVEQAHAGESTGSAPTQD